MLREGDVREQPEVVRAALRRRHAGALAEQELDRWLEADRACRLVATRRDGLGQALHGLRRNGPEGELRALRRELLQVTQELQSLESMTRRILMRLPNLPGDSVPEGRGPTDSVELRRWREPPSLTFAARGHDELGASLGILDLPRATRLSGPRFPLLVGTGARLARALASFMLDLHLRGGYVEIAPPHLLRTETLEGTGHLPAHEEDLYHLPEDELWLSPTAEAQLVALHAGETLPAAMLPLAYTAATPAFRREAGSTRAATHGLLRQHQFDKVELVLVVAPEESESAWARLQVDAETVLRELDLPYRLVALPAGDLPFSSRRTCDLEVWMPGQGSYVEISSISDCGPFQARRLNMRYRPTAGSAARYPHTLNASALAIGRTIAALLENDQRADGSVALPEALSAYLPELLLKPR
jgi:seryl-tRNA synthetase